MKPAPVILRVVRVRKARERERLAREREAVITRDALLARVEDAHAKQLAVILVREGQELRHGTAGGQSVTTAAAIRPTRRLIEAAMALMAVLLRRGSSTVVCGGEGPEIKGRPEER